MADGLDPFLAQFWDEKVAWRANGDRAAEGEQVIRAGGEHYVVGPEDKPGLRGFYGDPFAFRLNGGELVHTTNLRHQGEIPPEYVDQLPDNAEQVRL